MITVALGPGDGREAFAGPLDLLLALVRRHGYPLDRLPVAALTRAYNRCLAEAREADLELGGEYLETASWLLLLKSRSLLPAAPGGAEEGPEQELARALLDPAAVRRAAAVLGERLDGAGLGSGPGPESGLGSEGEAGREALSAETVEPAQRPTVADALQAARRALAAAQAHARAANEVPDDPYPVEQVLAALDTRLRELTPGRGVSTAPWFGELAAPEARAALLLALLELAREGRVWLHQHAEDGPVLLHKPKVQITASERHSDGV